MSGYQTEQEFYTEGGTERLPSVMKRGCEVAFAKIKPFFKNNRYISCTKSLEGMRNSVKLTLTSLGKGRKFEMAAGLPTSF